MFQLSEVVPWGRSLAEYRRMFSLCDADLRRAILGCADGPASFNAELTASGGSVVSGDPIYQFSADEIRTRIRETFPLLMEQTRLNAEEFIWSDDIPNVETLGRQRMQSMQTFLDDFSAGKQEGRYVECHLPVLPFATRQFELALCSHFLFLYSEQLSEQFHVDSIRELCRVGYEVRIFPLLELGGTKSRHLDSVKSALRNDGLHVEVQRVDYEFQKGGNQLLRVSPASSKP